MVVSIEACRISSRCIAMGAPVESNQVRYVWRNVCQPTFVPSVHTENSISVKKEGEVKLAAESASLGLQVR